jgi:pectinesterase
MKFTSLIFLTLGFALFHLPQLKAQAPVPAHVTCIVLVGDSTMASGSGWGDAFSKLLAPGVKCLNMAIKGRSSKSYRDEGHWQDVLNAKPDWVLIQFGHNDQPGKGPKLETDAATTFRDNMKRYVTEAQAIGARPILITSLTRRNFDAQGKLIADQLVPYAEATRAVAAEMHVPLVDLYARSFEQISRLGPQGSLPFNAKGKDPSTPDTTHLSSTGAAETAKLVADEIRKASPELAELLRP